MSLRTPPELYHAVLEMLDAWRVRDRPLGDFLLAFRAAVLEHADAESLTPHEFLAVLRAGLIGPVPAVDTAPWRAADADRRPGDAATAGALDRTLRTRILDQEDLAAARAAGTVTGASFPRRDRPGAHPTGYLRNATTWAFVERGADGAFDSWVDEGEGPPAGPAWVTWDDVLWFLQCGQTGE